MRFRLLLFPLLALPFLGMSHKPPCSIRFYVAANKKDGAPFIRKVQIGDSVAYVSKMAAIGEADVRSVFPYMASDGTWGCGLKLDMRGALRLDTMSTECRGQPLICVVNGRLITAMLIDKEIKDGVLYIPNGLTIEDVAIIRSRFHVMGEGKKHRKHEEVAAAPAAPAGSFGAPAVSGVPAARPESVVPPRYSQGD